MDLFFYINPFLTVIPLTGEINNTTNAQYLNIILKYSYFNNKTFYSYSHLLQMESIEIVSIPKFQLCFYNTERHY